MRKPTVQERTLAILAESPGIEAAGLRGRLGNENTSFFGSTLKRWAKEGLIERRRHGSPVRWRYYLPGQAPAIADTPTAREVDRQRLTDMWDDLAKKERA